MPSKAKYYIGTMIAAGAAVLLLNLPGLAPTNWPAFLVCVALAAILSPLKLRLPGMDGTYAPSFIPVLYGIANLGLPETLAIGLTVALAQSYINSKKRPTPVQVAFNAANLVLSIGVCFLVKGLLLGAGLAATDPVVGVLIAGLYFGVNTGVVSGVLSLLQGKTLSDVTESWYVWSFPYYLAGAAAVNLVASGLGGMRWEGVVVLVALLGLLHFYCGLAEGGHSSPLRQGDVTDLPGAARLCLIVVLAGAAIVLAASVVSREPINGFRFAAIMGLTVVASALKVRLPGLESSISLGFVVLLFAVVELSPGEVCLLAAAALVQCLWSPGHRIRPVQAAFSVGSLVLASGLAASAVRVMGPSLNGSLAGQVGLATVLLYGANTLIVSTMLAIVEHQGVGAIWRRSHFWVFPYYLVGAAAAALLVSTSRANGWLPALLVLPTMALVYVSYRVQVNCHAGQPEPSQDACPKPTAA